MKTPTKTTWSTFGADPAGFFCSAFPDTVYTDNGCLSPTFASEHREAPLCMPHWRALVLTNAGNQPLDLLAVSTSSPSFLLYKAGRRLGSCAQPLALLLRGANTALFSSRPICCSLGSRSPYHPRARTSFTWPTCPGSWARSTPFYL